MKMLRTAFALCLLGIIGIFALSTIEAAPPLPPEGQYKNYYSDGWFGTYALREFDKVAPAPGANWFVEDAQDWLERAQREGWVVKRKPSDAANGAIILGYHEDMVWVGIASEVTDKGLIFETFLVADGKPARYPMSFSDISTMIHFQGCILPQRIPGAQTVNPLFDYKSVRGYNGAAWPVREYDKAAPKPGFNWQGSENEWAVEAARKGWVVEKRPSAAKKGSLLLFYNSDLMQPRVAFVRDVKGPIIVFEYVDLLFSRVVTARLSSDQLMDKTAFGGFIFNAFILPERKAGKDK